MPPTTTTPSLEEILTALTTKTTTPATPKVTPSSTTITTPSTTVATPRTIVTTPKTTVTTPRTTVTTSSTTVSTPRTAVTTPRTTVTTSETTVTTPVTTVKIPIVLLTTSTAAATTPATTAAPTTAETATTKGTTAATSSASTKTFLNTNTTSISKILTTNNQEKAGEMIPIYTSVEKTKLVKMYDNTTFVTTSNSISARTTTESVTEKVNIEQIFKKEDTLETTTEPVIIVKTVPNVQQKPTEVVTMTEMLTTIPSTPPVETILKTETTKKETTIRILPTTVKFKPKEIWIRPAQKGESSIVETKIKTTHEFPRYRSANNKELTPTVTTPKTIIVSIIPTSVSYSTFKKIALTSSFISSKNSSTAQSYNKTEIESTKPMMTETSTPPVKLSPLSRKDLLATSYFINKTLVPSTSVTPKQTTSSIKPTTLVMKSTEVTKTMPRINRTNSMTTDINKNVSTSITTTSSTTRTTLKQNDLLTTSTNKSIKTSSAAQSSTETTTKHLIKYVIPKKVNVAPVSKTYNKPTNPTVGVDKEFKMANVTKSITKVTTDGPTDDEEFHILTEPEHITAVMGEKGSERSSVDLVSVISIAGGVMMAVITVAVVIVMIERCKKPRYEDVRKINDIRMQVMIDNNDVPPPYVRSIFHTPLPGK